MQKLIAIEGNIGAGKTSLAYKLAADFQAEILLEQFEDNPFLADFYKNPTQHAFTTETHFLIQRYNQIQNQYQRLSEQNKPIIADFCFWKSLIFAQKTLPALEYELFRSLFEVINTRLPKPDLLIYITRSPTNLLQNIHQRNRAYEQYITPDYLSIIEQGYHDFLQLHHGFPCVLVNATDLDLLHNPEHYAQITALLQGILVQHTSHTGAH